MSNKLKGWLMLLPFIVAFVILIGWLKAMFGIVVIIAVCAISVWIAKAFELIIEE